MHPMTSKQIFLRGAVQHNKADERAFANNKQPTFHPLIWKKTVCVSVCQSHRAWLLDCLKWLLTVVIATFFLSLFPLLLPLLWGFWLPTYSSRQLNAPVDALCSGYSIYPLP